MSDLALNALATEPNAAHVAVAEVAPALDLMAPLVPAPTETTVVVETTVTPAAAPTEVQPVEQAAIKHHSDKPSFLSEGLKNDTTTEPAEGEKKPDAVEPVVEVAAAPEPIEYEFEIPEDVILPSDAKDKLHKRFNEFGLTKEKGQTAFSAYVEELRNIQRDELQRQNDAFMKVRESWADKIRTDPVIGQKAAMQTIFRVRDRLVPPEDRKDFDELIAMTGAGDHIALARIFYRAAQFTEERRAPDPNIGTPPDAGRNPSASRGMRRVYGSTSGTTP